MRSYTCERRVVALIILGLVPPFLLQAYAVSGSATTARSGAANRDVRRRPSSRADETPCGECGASASTRRDRNLRGKNAGRRPTVLPCHPPGYVDPRLARDFNAALREMKRAGIQPNITSTWRSSGDQNKMYRCSISRQCRVSHPGLYRALPPGQSVHEAGFAVDISGIATGPRGSKRLTRQGRRIVQIMESHGFRWRYGLMDPVHFEADPRKHGYVSLRQAITVNQTRCQAAVAQKRNTRQNIEKAGTRASAKQNVEKAGTRLSVRQQATVRVAQPKNQREHRRLPRA